MKRLLYPGTFDPFTKGHESIVRRSLAIADEVVIAMGTNEAKQQHSETNEEFAKIRSYFEDDPRVKVIQYSGKLTIQVAQELGASAFIRGIRNVQDMEYERTIAEMNRQLSGIDTLFMFTEPRYAHISSSVVRELLRYGEDVTLLLPQKREK